MTIPLIRKRAKRPKTRTGCRTCRARHVKCDEARPTCARCSKAGRVCDGYDHIPVVAPPSEAAIGADATVMPRTPSALTTVLISGPAASMALSLADHEIWAFEFFRHHTVRHLPGNSSVFAWEKLIASMCGHPAVIHAAAAIGSLHRSLVRQNEDASETYSQRQSEHYQFALDQCNKAISFVRSHIVTLGKDSTDTDVEIVLLVSLLFFCFEIFNEDSTRAIVHFQTGIRILYERVRDRHGVQPNDKRVIEMRTNPQTNMDLITLAFVRLDHDFTLSNSCASYLHAVVHEAMPASFVSVDQAMVHLDALHTISDNLNQALIKYHRGHLSVPTPRPAYWTDEHSLCLAIGRVRGVIPDQLPEQHVARIQEQQLAVRQWMSALAFVPYLAENELAHVTVQMRFFPIWIKMETWLDSDPMAVDRFSDQFSHMLELAERYVAVHNVAVLDASLAASPLASPAIPSSTPLSTSYSQSTTMLPGLLLPPSSSPSAAIPRAMTPATRWNRLNQPGYNLGTGLVECLVTIIISSRDSAIRRRSLALLRTIDFTGISDSTWLVPAMQCVVDLEERSARLSLGRDPNLDMRDLLSSEVPASARLIEFDAGDGSSMTSTSSNAQSPSLTDSILLEDDGSLVYAMLDGFGDVHVDAATFVVPREASYGSESVIDPTLLSP